jgi:hypothetical protein
MTSYRQEGINNGAPAVKSSEQASFALHSADDNGIKTIFSGPTTATTYSGTDLNGALMTAGELTGTDARNPTVKLSAAVGSYVALGQIVVRGIHPYTRGNLSETLIMPDADGGVTLTCAKMFAASEPLYFDFPALPDAVGNIELGAGVAREITPPCLWLQVNEAGTLYLRLLDSSDTKITKWVVPVAGQLPVSADAIHSGSDITDLVPVVKGV